MKEILLGTLALYLLSSFILFDFTYILHMGEWGWYVRLGYFFIWLIFIGAMVDSNRHGSMD